MIYGIKGFFLKNRCHYIIFFKYIIIVYNLKMNMFVEYKTHIFTILYYIYFNVYVSFILSFECNSA